MKHRPLRGALNVVRDLWRLAIVDQVREGLLRPQGWPDGLGAIVGFSAVTYAALTVAVMFASSLRADSPLTSAADTVTLPAPSVPLLLFGLLLSLALMQTAALHAAWYLRVAALVIALLAIAEFAIPASNEPIGLIAALGSGLGLIGLTLIRIGRRFAWWEFVVTSVIFGTGILIPIAVQSLGVVMGYDWRPRLLLGGITTLSVLAFPTIMAAGAALAQLSVSVAEVGATSAARELPRGLFLGALVAVVVWRGLDIGLTTQWTATPWSATSLAAALFQAAVAAVLMEWMRRLSRRRRLPLARDLAGRWSGLMYPVAIGCTWILVLLLPFTLLRAIGAAIHNDLLFGVADAALWLASAPWQAVAFRFAVGLVCLLVAVRQSRRGEIVGSLVLVAFTAVTLLDVIGLIPGQGALGADSASATALLATLAAIVIGVWRLATGGITMQSAVALLTVLLLCAVYPHRAMLDNPISSLLGFSGLGAMLFGLLWNALTQGGFAREDSRALPRPTRVLGFCAVSLFAVTALAFVVLSRSSGEIIDVTPYASLGDTYLGTPLFLASVLIGLRLGIAAPGEVI